MRSSVACDTNPWPYSLDERVPILLIGWQAGETLPKLPILTALFVGVPPAPYLVPRLRLGTHCRQALPAASFRQRLSQRMARREPRNQRVPRRSLGTRY